MFLQENCHYLSFYRLFQGGGFQVCFLQKSLKFGDFGTPLSLQIVNSIICPEINSFIPFMFYTYFGKAKTVFQILINL